MITQPPKSPGFFALGPLFDQTYPAAAKRANPHTYRLSIHARTDSLLLPSLNSPFSRPLTERSNSLATATITPTTSDMPKYTNSDLPALRPSNSNASIIRSQSPFSATETANSCGPERAIERSVSPTNEYKLPSLAGSDPSYQSRTQESSFKKSLRDIPEARLQIKKYELAYNSQRPGTKSDEKKTVPTTPASSAPSVTHDEDDDSHLPPLPPRLFEMHRKVSEIDILALYPPNPASNEMFLIKVGDKSYPSSCDVFQTPTSETIVFLHDLIRRLQVDNERLTKKADGLVELTKEVESAYEKELGKLKQQVIDLESDRLKNDKDMQLTRTASTIEVNALKMAYESLTKEHGELLDDYERLWTSCTAFANAVPMAMGRKRVPFERRLTPSPRKMSTAIHDRGHGMGESMYLTSENLPPDIHRMHQADELKRNQTVRAPVLNQRNRANTLPSQHSAWHRGHQNPSIGGVAAQSALRPSELDSKSSQELSTLLRQGSVKELVRSTTVKVGLGPVQEKPKLNFSRSLDSLHATTGSVGGQRKSDTVSKLSAVRKRYDSLVDKNKKSDKRRRSRARRSRDADPETPQTSSRPQMSRAKTTKPLKKKAKKRKIPNWMSRLSIGTWKTEIAL